MVIQEEHCRLLGDSRNAVVIKQNQQLALANYENTIHQYVIESLIESHEIWAGMSNIPIKREIPQCILYLIWQWLRQNSMLIH